MVEDPFKKIYEKTPSTKPLNSELKKKMVGVNTSICRGAEPGYRTLEVRVGKDDTKPKASKLSGGSLRVIGGPKQRYKKIRGLKN